MPEVDAALRGFGAGVFFVGMQRWFIVLCRGFIVMRGVFIMTEDLTRQLQPPADRLILVPLSVTRDAAPAILRLAAVQLCRFLLVFGRFFLKHQGPRKHRTMVRLGQRKRFGYL